MPGPATTETLRLKDLTMAQNAGAKGDCQWLKTHFGQVLDQEATSKPLSLSNFQLSILREYQDGLGFLKGKKIEAKTLDETDEHMADPLSPIKTTSALNGLLSGLRKDENRAAEYFLDRPGSLDWALWCRLGYALASTPSHPAPTIDRIFKQYIISQRNGG